MDVELVRVQEDGSTAEVPIKHATTTFGRGEDCTVRVPAASVSRKHCQLTVEGGAIEIQDLGSSNGTYVNQDRVEKAPLAAGDLISFGGFVFVVRVNGEPEEIDGELMYEDGLPEEDHGAAVSSGPNHPTTTGAAAAPAPGRAAEPLVARDDADESSMVDFDLDFDEEEDEQPPL